MPERESEHHDSRQRELEPSMQDLRHWLMRNFGWELIEWEDGDLIF